MNLYEVIKKPLITEKSSGLKDTQNTYVFAVAAAADKPLIKRAVESLFKVKVANVRTAIVPGKSKKSGNHESRSSAWKKAFVRLSEGKIELFEGV
jgi:large subunit ribosomal protein L23